MKKTIVGFLAAALFVPAAAFAYVDCNDNINGCSTTEAKIAALQAQILQLTQLLAQLIAQKSSTPITPTSCFVPTYDLYIGKTDAQTNGEVSRL